MCASGFPPLMMWECVKGPSRPPSFPAGMGARLVARSPPVPVGGPFIFRAAAPGSTRPAGDGRRPRCPLARRPASAALPARTMPPPSRPGTRGEKVKGRTKAGKGGNLYPGPLTPRAATRGKRRKAPRRGKMKKQGRPCKTFPPSPCRRLSASGSHLSRGSTLTGAHPRRAPVGQPLTGGIVKAKEVHRATKPRPAKPRPAVRWPGPSARGPYPGRPSSRQKRPGRPRLCGASFVMAGRRFPGPDPLT